VGMVWVCEPDYLGASGTATGATLGATFLWHEFRCPAGGRSWYEGCYHEPGQAIQQPVPRCRVCFARYCNHGAIELAN